LENWHNSLLQTKGISVLSNEIPKAHLQHLQQQLEIAKKEIDTLKMRPKESLRDFEYRAKELSDKLLALKIAEQVQQQLLEQEAREAEAELKKNPS
jgi:lantibiotic modifying enzyme